MIYLRKSAPEIHKDCTLTSHSDKGASKAGEPPPKAVAKIATLSRPSHPPYELSAISEPVKSSVAVNRPPPALTPSEPDHGVGVTLEAMDNMVGLFDSTASSSAQEHATTPESAPSHCFPAPRQIKQHIGQLIDDRAFHQDQVRLLTRSPEMVSYAF